MTIKRFPSWTLAMCFFGVFLPLQCNHIDHNNKTNLHEFLNSLILNSFTGNGYISETNLSCYDSQCLLKLSMCLASYSQRLQGNLQSVSLWSWMNCSLKNSLVEDASNCQMLQTNFNHFAHLVNFLILRSCSPHVSYE